MPFRLQRPPPPPAPSTRPTRPQPTHPTLTQKLTHLSTPLHPLLNITTGLPHPSFPRTLLNYHLLTHAQLDELASYYHQRTPGPWMFCYPFTEGREGAGGEGREGEALGWRREGMGLEVKRRKFGRFCGLRGCESPGFAVAGSEVEAGGGDEMVVDGEEEEVLMVFDAVCMEREGQRETRERMEREWAGAVRRGREEEERREKIGGRRFW